MSLNLDGLKTHVISTDETGNSTKTLLTSSATYTGAWEDVTNFSTVAVALIGSLATDGTLYIESSQDGGSVVNSVPYPISDTSFALPIIWNVVESHIRIRYVNGTTAQTGTFQLQTKYSNAQELGLSQSAGDTISSTTACQVTKAIATGTDPNAAYQNQVVSGVDDGNSSDATLGISAVFTGVWQDLSGYHGISVLVDGTSAGTADGVLQMQFSHDGSTVHRDISVPYTDVTAAAPKTLGVVAQYFRVIYTNGTTATTSFDLQTMLHTTQVSLVSRLSGTMSDNTDVTDTRSVNMGKQPDGTYLATPIDGTAFDTSANLGSSATYTSSWFEVTGFNDIQLYVSSDVISAVKGFKIEFSHEFIAPAIEETIYHSFTATDVARGYLEINLPPRLEAFRIVYINGATAQTSFLLHCDLKVNGTANTYNAGGGLLTSEFNSEVALGNVPNYESGKMYGLVSLTDSADGPSTVWSYADDDLTISAGFKSKLPTAVQMWVASDSASDVSSIEIEYYSATHVLSTVTVTMNGTTPVDCGVTARDVKSAKTDNIGHIYVQQGNAFTAGVADDPLDVMAHIKPTYGISDQCFFRVPANKQMIINHVFIAMQRAGGVAGSATAMLLITEDSGITYIARPYLVGSSQVINSDENIVLSAGDVVEVVCFNVSDSDTDMMAEVKYQLITV